MAAYLQWRRFVFFEREAVKEPPGPDGGGKPLALPPGLAVCDSGRGSLVFGDILGGAGRAAPAGKALAALEGHQLPAAAGSARRSRPVSPGRFIPALGVRCPAWRWAVRQGLGLE